MALTILGGNGFVGGEYVRQYYDAAIGNIASVNKRDDLNVYSSDVLYLISTVHNQNVYSDPFLDINTNLITLVKTLENWRRRPDASRGVFNFVSSWFVCSDVKGFYTSTKRCAEELLESYCKAFGLHYRILRLCNILGSKDKKVSYTKNALQYVIGRVVAGEEVVIRPVQREYMHVEDCAEAIETVMSKGEVNTTYNIGSGELTHFDEAVRYAAKKVNSLSTIATLPSTDVAHLPDTSKLRGLGYIPKHTFTSMLDEIIAGALHEDSNSHHKR